MIFLTRIFLSFLLLTGLVEAKWFGKSKVREITAKSFNSNVARSDNVSVVLFYEPWCPHCKTTAPELKKSAKSLQGIINVFAVNCQLPVNKNLCVSQKIESLPTIKVFQPAKKTDVDWKDLVEGKTPAAKKPRVYKYIGLREAKAINKFATSKLRNYAASLVSEEAISWFRVNQIPRVIMLPGSKYKSKSIAPLFKVLSNEYFGKIRFGYVPRRVDGAWNLLGLKAVEKSQLVYMSDDKEPVVYLGDLTKKAVKKFLDEQYGLEMQRREQRNLPLTPSRENAANGLEWILEDAQKEEMEHVQAARKELEADHVYMRLSQAHAEEELRKERAEAAGKEYVPRKITEEMIRAELEEQRASLTSKAEAARAKATADSLGIKEDEEISEDLRLALDGEDMPEFEVDENAPEAEEPSAETVELDEEAANIDDSDDAQEAVDAVLDEIDFELLPEEVVEEGPEAIESYNSMISSIKAAHAKTATAAAAKPGKPGVTPAGKPRAHDYMESISDTLRNCIRANKPCVLMATSQDFSEEDKNVLLIARGKLTGAVNANLVYNYFRFDDSDEMQQLYTELGFEPQYFRTSRSDKTKEVPQALVAIFDHDKRRMSHMTGEYTSEHIVKHIADYLNKKAPTKIIPKKYRLMVTKEDVELMGFRDESEEKEGHDEL